MTNLVGPSEILGVATAMGLFAASFHAIRERWKIIECEMQEYSSQSSRAVNRIKKDVGTSRWAQIANWLDGQISRSEIAFRQQIDREHALLGAEMRQRIRPVGKTVGIVFSLGVLILTLSILYIPRNNLDFVSNAGWWMVTVVMATLVMAVGRLQYIIYECQNDWLEAEEERITTRNMS